MKHLLSLAFLLFTAASVCCQVKYQGVIKITAQQSLKAINGSWDSTDHTGNTTIDKMLDKFAASYKTKPTCIKALEGTAAQIKTNPAKYINEDGSVNKKALADLLKQKFNSVGEVTVPSVETVQEEGSQN